VENRYRPPAGEGTADHSANGFRDRDAVLADTSASETLEGLTKKSMDRLGEILDLELPNGELDDTVKVAKLLLTAADTSLKVQVRVDEARLRRQNVDILPEIHKILAEEKAKLDQLRTVEAIQ
jgi:hypothetical protein